MGWDIKMEILEKNRIILIPAYEPDSRLISYVKELNGHGLHDIVIVNDGSGESHKNIFGTLKEMGCVVLTHKYNQGKGMALKTGYHYIHDTYPDYACIITADADGQHAAEDVFRMANEAVKNPDSLILGERNFKQSGIPAKSLMGNRLTSTIFALFFGRYLPDTQTGLRAFGPMLTELMWGILGERFEYETRVLIYCIRSKVPIVPVEIQTIYENENRGTHFHPIKDSFKIISVITSDFMKFISTSILCAAIDIGLAWVLFDLLRRVLPGADFLRIMTATAAARVVSIGVNYFLNKNLVFCNEHTGTHSLLRYLALCVINMVLSALSVYLLHTFLRMDEKAAKIICDVILFLFNYQLQSRWVFAIRGLNHEP